MSGQVHQIPASPFAGDTGKITPGLAGGGDPKSAPVRLLAANDTDADAMLGRWGEAEYWLAVLGRVNRDTFHGER